MIFQFQCVFFLKWNGEKFVTLKEALEMKLSTVNALNKKHFYLEVHETIDYSFQCVFIYNTL